MPSVTGIYRHLPHREATVEKRKLPYFTLSYVLSIALALAIVIMGAVKLRGDWTVISIGFLGVILAAITWPLAEALATDRRAPTDQAGLEALTERVERI